MNDTPHDLVDPLRNDPTIARLRAGLDALTAHAADTPPRLPLERHVHVGPIGDGSGRRWLAVAAATLLIVGAAGLWFAGRQGERPANVDELPQSFDPLLPLPFVPDGWELVEWDAVRFAVPDTLRIYDGGCAADVAPSDSGVTLTCGGPGDQPVTISINDVEFEPDDQAAAVDGPNGLAYVEFGGDGCEGCLLYRGYPLLGVEIGIGVPAGSGALAEQLWTTIAPSGRWRAANRPAPPIPDDWVEVEFEGVTVSVPPDWPVRELGDDLPGPCAVTFERPEVTTTIDDVPIRLDRCPSIIQPTRPGDGVRLARTDAMDLAPGWPVGARRFNVVDPADPHVVVVYVGFDDDPTVGAAILASVRLTSG